MNKKLNFNKKIVIGIDILLFIIIVVYLFVNRRNTEMNSYYYNHNEYEVFKYSFPKKLGISNYNDKQFKIDGDGWYTLVKLYYDNDKDIYNNTDVFAGFVRFIEDSDINYYISKVNGINTVIFENTNDNSVICYFATDWLFDYEIRIFNDDKTYKIDALNEIMAPLLNPINIDYEHIDIFNFDIVDIK